MVEHSSTNLEMQQILTGALEITRKAVSEVCEDARASLRANALEKQTGSI